ncbi:MAG TPA: phosphatase PAP2 family protein [Acidobacteriaceae bacterium]|nr:phosphatase PAP2 family protein [Acidobacteriaceae bacterium]
MRFPAACLLVALLFPVFASGQSGQPQCQLSALKICAVHVAQDEAGILASPVRTTPRDLFWLVPFGVATGVAIDYDAHAMRSLGVDVQRQNRFETVSNVGAFYVPLAASGAGYFIGGFTHNDLLRETAVLSAEAMADATILNQGLKYAIDRQDPQQGDGTGRFWPHGPSTWPDGQSMPSEHAMNVWAFAHVVATQYNGPATKAIVYSLATTVSVSRVLARQHFPSDVLVGSVFGYLIGGYVEHHRSREAGYLSLSSVSTPNGRGLQLSFNFAH